MRLQGIYAFPPTFLLPKVLEKTASANADLLLAPVISTSRLVNAEDHGKETFASGCSVNVSSYFAHIRQAAKARGFSEKVVTMTVNKQIPSTIIFMPESGRCSVIRAMIRAVNNVAELFLFLFEDKGQTPSSI
jgi:hypothetical protein